MESPLRSIDLDVILADEPEPEPWRQDQDWLWMACHHELGGSATEVLLECTSTVLGRRVTTRIGRSGCWVWRPDAQHILALGPLASCRGIKYKVNRPFFVASPSERALVVRPYGPPEK